MQVSRCQLARGGVAARGGRAGRGFTLIEVMLVVGIMGILATFAVPNLMGIYRRMTLSGEARRLYAAFVSAQGLAGSTGRKHCVFLDRANRRWSVREDSNADGVCQETDRLITAHPKGSERAPAGISFGPSNGVAAPFPVPYHGVDHSAWHTPGAPGDPSGGVVFDSEGRIVDATDAPVNGAVLMHDAAPGSSGNVQALVYIGATGNLRLFNAVE